MVVRRRSSCACPRAWPERTSRSRSRLLLRTVYSSKQPRCRQEWLPVPNICVDAANEPEKPEHSRVSDEPRASQRWYPVDRTVRSWIGGFFALQGLYQTFSNLNEATLWKTLAHLSLVLASVAYVVLSRMAHVEATGRGLRIVKPFFSDRVISWHDIADVRREPPDAGATKLAIVLQHGEVVDLRLSIDVRRELVERWRLETG